MRISVWSSDVCSSDLKSAYKARSTAWQAGTRLLKAAPVFIRTCEMFLAARPVAISADPLVSGHSDSYVRRVRRVACADCHADRGAKSLSSEERRVGKELVSTCRSRW